MVEEAGRAAHDLIGHGVVIPRLLPCGECDYCRRGAVAACASLAQVPRPDRPVLFETLPARYLFPLRPPLVPKVPATDALWPLAALADALLTPYTGFCMAGAAAGTFCVVIGDGPRAAMTAVVAESLGLAVEVCAINALAAETAASAKRRLTDTAAALGLSAAGQLIVETTGTATGRLWAAELAEPGGALLLFPRSPSSPEHWAQNPQALFSAVAEDLVAAQVQIIPVAPHPDLLPELFALVRRAEIDLSAQVQAVPPAGPNDPSGDRLPIVVYGS